MTDNLRKLAAEFYQKVMDREIIVEMPDLTAAWAGVEVLRESLSHLTVEFWYDKTRGMEICELQWDRDDDAEGAGTSPAEALCRALIEAAK